MISKGHFFKLCTVQKWTVCPEIYNEKSENEQEREARSSADKNKKPGKGSAGFEDT